MKKNKTLQAIKQGSKLLSLPIPIPRPFIVKVISCLFLPNKTLGFITTGLLVITVNGLILQ